MGIANLATGFHFNRSAHNDATIGEPVADAVEKVGQEGLISVTKPPFRPSPRLGRASEQEMAEQDAWYIFGVDKVINTLEVIPPH